MPASQLSSTLAEQAEQVRARGYCVVESVLTPEQVAEAGSALDRILDYEKQHGDRALWDNPAYQISFLLITKDKIFRELCQCPALLELVRLLLGQDCVIGSVNGYSPRPNGSVQALHPDRLLPGGSIGALTALLTLDQFTRENGCLRVVPYSQNRDVPSGVDKHYGCEELEAQAIDVEVPPGTLIVYNAALVHGSGQNRTCQRRRAIHISLSKPGIPQEWDFPSIISKELESDLSEEELKLFGYYTRPERNDLETRGDGGKQRRGLRYYLRRFKSKFLTP